MIARVGGPVLTFVVWGVLAPLEGFVSAIVDLLLWWLPCTR